MIEAGLRFRGVSVAEERDRRGCTSTSSPSTPPTSPSAAGPLMACRSCSTGSLAGGARLAVCTNKFEGLSRELLQRARSRQRVSAPSPERDTFAVCKPDAGPSHRHDRDGGRPARARGDGRRQRGRLRHRAGGRAFRRSASPSATRRGPCASWPRVGVGAVIDHYREFMPALERVLTRTAVTRRTGAQTSRDSLSLAAPKVISWPVSSSGTGVLPSFSPSRRVPLVEPRSRKLRPCSGS